ncbi:hypothetical protein FB451DRAFT_516471 [Mycena latifolia]|nr:hypothetical protein FB451DRAFT_516471 [Mycena latifolia]
MSQPARFPPLVAPTVTEESDFEWYYGSDAGGMKMSFGEYRGKEMNTLDLPYLLYQRKRSWDGTSFAKAFDKYHDGLWEHVDSEKEDNYLDVLVPFGKFRGKRFGDCHDKGYFLWCQEESELKLTQKYDLFFRAIEMLLDVEFIDDDNVEESDEQQDELEKLENEGEDGAEDEAKDGDESEDEDEDEGQNEDENDDGNDEDDEAPQSGTYADSRPFIVSDSAPLEYETGSEEGSEAEEEDETDEEDENETNESDDGSDDEVPQSGTYANSDPFIVSDSEPLEYEDGTEDGSEEDIPRPRTSDHNRSRNKYGPKQNAKKPRPNAASPRAAGASSYVDSNLDTNRAIERRQTLRSYAQSQREAKDKKRRASERNKKRIRRTAPYPASSSADLDDPISTTIGACEACRRLGSNALDGRISKELNPPPANSALSDDDLGEIKTRATSSARNVRKRTVVESESSDASTSEEEDGKVAAPSTPRNSRRAKKRRVDDTE